MRADVLQSLTVLVRLSPDDLTVLRSAAGTTQAWTDDVVRSFYDTLFAHPGTRAVFSSEERPQREATLRGWYEEVTSGAVDDAFWARQWFVGLVHIQRKVSNAFMLGMTSHVQQLFLERCLDAFEPARARAVFLAFKRVTDVVAGLIAESYFVSYIESLSEVAGIRPTLVQRMMDVDIRKRIDQARAAMGVRKPQAG